MGLSTMTHGQPLKESEKACGDVVANYRIAYRGGSKSKDSGSAFKYITSQGLLYVIIFNSSGYCITTRSLN